MLVVVEPRRAIVCLAAALSCAGLAVPAPAFADDEAAPTVPTLPSTPDAAADDVLAGLLAEEADDVLDAAAAAVDAVGPAEQPTEPETVPAAPAQEEGPPAAGADEAASEVAPNPDITSEAGDTTGDSTDHPAPTPTPPAPAAPSPTQTARPAGALNINVDVRVSSAGDNGAVTQSNHTAASGAARPSATPSPSGAERTAAAPTSAAPTGSAASWYWEWDCLSQPSVPVVSAAGSGDASVPDSWIWIWNCGQNDEQYHEASEAQYQQINANISVRIASPGNNGPVSQTNIAISTGASTASGPSRPPTAPSAPSVPGAMQVAVGITVPTIAIVRAAFDAALPAHAQISGVPGIDEAIIGMGVEGTVDVAVGPAALVLGGADEPAPVRLRPVPLRGPALAPMPAPGELRLPPHPGAAVRIAPRWAAGTRPTLRSADAPGHAASEGRTTGRAKRTPGERAPAPPAPPPAPSGVTASAAGAAGSSGGGIPIFLALPFVAAMLDLARRVALDRATWPSGHRRRVPDRPG